MNALELLILAALVAAAMVVGVACGEILRRTLRWDAPGGPERVLLGMGGGVAFAIVCMIGNIVTGGAVFGLPGIVPSLAIASVYVGRAGFRFTLSSPRDRFALLLGVFVLVMLYVAPVLAAGSGVRTGDPPWHLGWTEQLLGGEPVPPGPAPEFARNAYPWGWHAVLATMVRLVPGSDAVLAHDAMHVILVGAIPLAAACLARRVRPDAGWAAATCASVIGGFGWIAAGGPAFDASPRGARFGADLVVASPNSVYELMPPALPRELGLVLLGLMGIMLIRALVAPERRTAAAAGVALGMVGLVSVPMLLSGAAWTAAALVLLRRISKDIVVPLSIGAIATFALWAGPVVAGYARYGGFVNITPRLGQEWSVGSALMAWGVLLPLAIVGLAFAARVPDIGRRVVTASAIASGALVAFAVLRSEFGWDLLGNATLLHQGRTWPPAHLLGAALGGAGVLWAWEWARARSREVAAVAAAGLVFVGAASPVLASSAMRDILEQRRHGFIYSAPELRRDGYVRAAARHLDPDDIAAAFDDDTTFHLFEFSGARLADYDHPRLEENDLRIRYSDLAAMWQSTTPFCPTHELNAPGALLVEVDPSTPLRCSAGFS